MGMVAILVIWPGSFEQTFVPPSHRSSIWNLTFFSETIKEWTDDDRRTEAYLSYKLTNEPSAQLS